MRQQARLDPLPFRCSTTRERRGRGEGEGEERMEMEDGDETEDGYGDESTD